MQQEQQEMCNCPNTNKMDYICFKNRFCEKLCYFQTWLLVLWTFFFIINTELTSQWWRGIHFYFILEGKKRQRVARLNAPFEPQYLDKTNQNSSWRVSCVPPKISNTYMHIKWVKCMASAPSQVCVHTQRHTLHLDLGLCTKVAQ